MPRRVLAHAHYAAAACDALSMHGEFRKACASHQLLSFTPPHPSCCVQAVHLAAAHGHPACAQAVLKKLVGFARNRQVVERMAPALLLAIARGRQATAKWFSDFAPWIRPAPQEELAGREAAAREETVRRLAAWSTGLPLAGEDGQWDAGRWGLSSDQLGVGTSMLEMAQKALPVAIDLASYYGIDVLVPLIPASEIDWTSILQSNSAEGLRLMVDAAVKAAGSTQGMSVALAALAEAGRAGKCGLCSYILYRWKPPSDDLLAKFGSRVREELMGIKTPKGTSMGVAMQQLDGALVGRLRKLDLAPRLADLKQAADALISDRLHDDVAVEAFLAECRPELQQCARELPLGKMLVAAALRGLPRTCSMLQQLGATGQHHRGLSEIADAVQHAINRRQVESMQHLLASGMLSAQQHARVTQTLAG